MKLAANILGALLGLLFAAFALMFLLKLVPMPPPPPAGTPPAMFMGAMGPTGYMSFVKILELTGGILVAFPLTRALGLLVLGPIIVNILAFQVFIMKGTMLLDPVLIFVCLAAGFLLWVERKAFLGLASRERNIS